MYEINQVSKCIYFFCQLVNCGTGTANSSGAHEFTPSF